MEKLDRITQRPEIMGGKACIRGIRVTVGMIVGQIGAGRSVDELLAEYPYLERKIFSRRYDMPRGGPRNVRSCWPTREASRRYEPIPALGRSAECGGSACGSLVKRWPDGRARYRDHGPRSQIRLRRIDARLGFQRHAGGNPGNEAQRRANSLGQPQPSSHRGPTDRGFTTDGSGVGGRRAAHGRSGSHPTPSITTTPEISRESSHRKR